MPFITEEIWHAIAERKEGDDIIIAQQPTAKQINDAILIQYSFVQEFVNRIRGERSKLNLSFKEPIELEIEDTEDDWWREIICVADKLCNINVSFTKERKRSSMCFMLVSKVIGIVNDNIDVEGEIKKLEEDLKHNQDFLKSVECKLSNEKFVNCAPAAIVEKERKKKADAEERIASIMQQLNELKK